MATHWPQVHNIARGVVEARWVATSFVASTDVVQPVELAGYPDRTITVQDTDWNSATFKLYGSNTPLTSAGPMVVSVATGIAVVDPQGNAITFSSDGTETLLEAHRWLMWTATSKATATGSTITVRIIANQRRA